MTDPSTARPIDGDTHVAVDPPPFLRITGTYPAANNRVSTVSLELNLDDDVPVGDVPDDSSSTWLADFCTDVISAMRARTTAQALVLTGDDAKGLLAAAAKHHDDCDGSCGNGVVLPLVRSSEKPAGDPAGQTGGE